MNPSDVNIVERQISFKEIFDMILSDKIILEHSFPCEEESWSCEQEAHFIESILLKVPVSPIWIYNNTVIDGLHRLNALYVFLNDSLELIRAEFFDDINNKYVHQLPRSMQRRIEETTVTCYFLYTDTSIEVAETLFKRLQSRSRV